MVRQIEPRLGEPRLATLEERLAELEARVAVLTEAVRVLARGLEGSPFGEPPDGGPEEAARHARELLMSPPMSRSPR